MPRMTTCGSTKLEPEAESGFRNLEIVGGRAAPRRRSDHFFFIVETAL